MGKESTVRGLLSASTWSFRLSRLLPCSLVPSTWRSLFFPFSIQRLTRKQREWESDSLSLSLAFFRSESAGTTRGATPAAPVPVPRRPPPPPPLLPLLQCTLALSSPSLPLLLLLASSSAVRLIGRGSEGKQRQRKFELELRDEGRESVGGSLTGIAFAFASRLLLLQPSPSCLIAGRRPSLQLLSLLSLQLRAACVHTILLI